MNYRKLTNKEQLEEIDALSRDQRDGVLIFKHSTRCAISSMALNRFLRGWELDEETMPVYYLDLIRHRDLSDVVASRYEINHESPQILLIKNGNCIYDASHYEIAPAQLKKEIVNG